MGHSTSTNYTVSISATQEFSGDSVANSTVPSSVVLVITPSAGYNVSASGFSIGSPFPIEILNAIFTDTTFANTPGNLVNVTVTVAPGFVMPSVNVLLLVDIDGAAVRQVSASSNITACITENIMLDGLCSADQWPNDGAPVSSTNTQPTLICNGNFANQSLGTSITATTGTNSNWPNPLNTFYPGTVGAIDEAATTQYTGSVTPNVNAVIFTKTFWTGPDRIFEITPFDVLNAAAIATGDYTITETPDDYNLDKTVSNSSSGLSSTVKLIDTVNVYPGMMVTGENVVSLALSVGFNTTPTGPFSTAYPWFYQDIRVVTVVGNLITLSEKINTTAGDILNFNSVFDLTANGNAWGANLPSQRHCLTKTFTVEYNSTTGATCGDHEIDFAFNSGYGINWALNPLPKITNVNVGGDTVNSNGETRTVVIQGDGAIFNLTITRSDGLYYNFVTGVFSGKSDILVNQTATVAVPFTKAIVFPETDADFEYVVTIDPNSGNPTTDFDNGTTFETGVERTHVLNQYVDKTVTFTSDATTSGLTLASGLTSPGTIIAPATYVFNRGKSVPSWTGNVTHTAVMYSTGATKASLQTTTDGVVTAAAAGDFTNATANSGEMDLDIVLSGLGSTTVTATVSGSIFKHPTADTTVTLDFDGFLQVRPTVPNVNVELDVVNKDFEGYITDAGGLIKKDGVISVRPAGSVEIDLRAFDKDANKAGKTLATVVVPKDVGGVQKGSLGSHSGGKVTYTADTNVTSRDVGKVIEFTYKGTVGGVDSDPASVFILIKE